MRTVSSFLCMLALAATGATEAPCGLTVERLAGPCGVDAAAPRLGWKMVAPKGATDVKQTAYRVLVASSAKKLAKECKEGKISPDYLSGASFTVSNIGSLGIESFTPVVNPPQTGILGVCAMKDAFRMNNGQIEVYPSMNLSLSYDHRALDGTPASKFLRDLKTNLENFTLMLAKG